MASPPCVVGGSLRILAITLFTLTATPDVRALARCRARGGWPAHVHHSCRRHRGWSRSPGRFIGTRSVHSSREDSGVGLLSVSRPVHLIMRVAASPFVMKPSTRSLPLFLLLMCTNARDDLRFHDVPADGNCLFASVALSASLTDNGSAQPQAVIEGAKRLRQMAMDLLCPADDIDPELVMAGLPASLLIEPLHGEDEAGYCQRMRRDGQWGSTAEILALARVLKREIQVHTSFGSVESYGTEEGEASGLVPLAVHFANSHYRAVTVRQPPAKRKAEL